MLLSDGTGPDWLLPLVCSCQGPEQESKACPSFNGVNRAPERAVDAQGHTTRLQNRQPRTQSLNSIAKCVALVMSWRQPHRAPSPLFPVSHFPTTTIYPCTIFATR